MLSIIESQLILPVHLSQRTTSGYMLENTRFVQGWIAFQTRLADALTNFAQQRYGR